MSDAILIVDDEANILDALRRALADDPYEVLTASDGQEGLQILHGRDDVKVVLSDERMPGMSGGEFLSRVREARPETVRMMLTGHASPDGIMTAVNNGGIWRFFVKPWDDMELRLSIRAAFDKYRLEAENRRLLRAVRRQAAELRILEASHPGIATLARDAQGRLIVPEVTEEEIAEVLARYERECH